MKTVEGDLIKLALMGKFDVIVHGCNCFNTMGAGIARSIKAHFPEAFYADLATNKGSKEKLGTISSARIHGDEGHLDVVNAYTQFRYRGTGPKVDYAAVESCFSLVAKNYPNARIGYPAIGAGLAGGDWTKIAKIIDMSLEGLDHTLVIFRPKA